MNIAISFVYFEKLQQIVIFNVSNVGRKYDNFIWVKGY